MIICLGQLLPTLKSNNNKSSLLIIQSRTFVRSISSTMNVTATALHMLFERIPRRHNLENVKEMNGIITEYEYLLLKIEGENTWYEKNIAPFFDEVESVKLLIKKSVDNKASKKAKDLFFDEASGALKDGMQSLLELYADGTRHE